MHVAVRLILPETPSVPVHDLKLPSFPVHLDQAPVCQMYAAHTFVLHARVVSGMTRPAHFARAALLPSEREHET